MEQAPSPASVAPAPPGPAVNPPRGGALHPFHARILGAVDWMCPWCNRFNVTSNPSWRIPRARCHNRLCRAIVEFGVWGRSSQFEVLGPTGCHLEPPRAAAEPANRWGPGDWSARKTAAGAIVGPVEWWCDCGAANKSAPNHLWGALAPCECGRAPYVALILRSPVRGAHASTPRDWIPPVRSLK